MSIEVVGVDLSSDSYRRVPGRCLSLVYCAEPPTVRAAGLGEHAKIAARSSEVVLVHGWQILGVWAKFRSKALWFKLVVLLALKRTFWLAVTPDRVAGMLGVRYDRLTHLPLRLGEACVYSVIVDDAFKGRGLGLLMLETVTSHLIDAGCSLVLLETGEQNDNMRRLLDRSRMFRFCGVSQRPLPISARRTIL